MKVILSRKTIIGILLVAVIGCGSTDDLIKEDGSNSSPKVSITESPEVLIVEQILGTWLLESLHLFSGHSGVWHSADLVTFYLTFKPDGTFQATHKYPIGFIADRELLAEKGLQHVKEVIVTILGDYEIAANQLTIHVLSSHVNPMQAAELDSDFENPGFLWVEEVGDSGNAEVYLGENDGILVFLVKDGKLIGEIIYERLQTELNAESTPPSHTISLE